MKRLLIALIASCLIAAAQAETHAKVWVGLVPRGDSILNGFHAPIKSGDDRDTTSAEAVASVHSSKFAFTEYSLGDGERVVSPPFLNTKHKVSLFACGYVHGAENGAYIEYGFPGSELRGSFALSGERGGLIKVFPVDDLYLVLVLALPQTP